MDVWWRQGIGKLQFEVIFLVAAISKFEGNKASLFVLAILHCDGIPLFLFFPYLLVSNTNMSSKWCFWSSMILPVADLYMMIGACLIRLRSWSSPTTGMRTAYNHLKMNSRSTSGWHNLFSFFHNPAGLNDLDPQVVQHCCLLSFVPPVFRLTFHYVQSLYIIARSSKSM
jgi:hypothetical protein